MRELVVLIWAILILLCGMLLAWSLKRSKRKAGKYVMYHKLILIVISFLTSGLLYLCLRKSPHLVWSVRLMVICLGTLNVWVIFKQKWTVRNKFKHEEDSFMPEFMFMLLSGLICATALVASPQVFGLVDYSKDLSRTLWDLPLMFILPFLILKITDFASQIPYRTVENPWLYPIEPTSAENWPWRDLMQANFKVRRSLKDEYNMFRWSASPWIEAPKEIGLGKIFALMMQERRKNPQLDSIQDMGIEYDGTPQFWWIFSIKKTWYRPSTWFRKPRYLNPDLSLIQNKVRERDVIIAKRIPGDGTKPALTGYRHYDTNDTEKTVLIQR